MKSFLFLFAESAREFKKVRCIALTGVLIAISVLIESLSISTPMFKINFAFLAIAIIGMLFGPTVSFFSGALCDIAGFLVHPDGGFLWAYVPVAMLQGLIYGICLYRSADAHSLVFVRNSDKKSTDITLFVKMVCARLLDVVIINIFINTKLNMYYGFIPDSVYSEAIIARTTKNILELIVDIPMMFILLPLALLIFNKSFSRASA